MPFCGQSVNDTDRFCTFCGAKLHVTIDTPPSQEKPKPKPKSKGPHRRKVSTWVFPSDYVVLDLETTGLNCKNDKIVEIACIKYRNHEKTDELHHLINPLMAIPSHITKINGITTEDVAHAPTFQEIEADLVTFISDEILIGHNISFDLNFLEQNFSSYILINKYVDTLRLARRICPDTENHKLVTLAEFFNIVSPEHRAMADCETTNALLWSLSKMAEARHLPIDRT